MLEEHYLAISALQHYAFCPRQFALIHIEQAWEDNRLTAEGTLLHERIDAGLTEQRRAIRYERSVSLISHKLRLVGKMDLLEVHTLGGKGEEPSATSFIPVEYKRGKSKVENWDRIQICAQAMCLEEMRDTAIAEGAIWYWQTRRRETVAISDTLRLETTVAIESAHQILFLGVTPPPVNDRRCRACSLSDLCRPNTFARDRTSAYIQEMYVESDGDHIDAAL